MRALLLIGLICGSLVQAAPEFESRRGVTGNFPTSGVWNQGTTSNQTYYVDTTGSDTPSCGVSAGATACLTIPYALNLIPKFINHTIDVLVGAGAFSGGIGYVQGFQFGPNGSLQIHGTLTALTPATGTATGTTTSRVTGSTTTQSTLTDSTQGWTSNNLRGSLVYISSGAGSGQYAMISSNTATAISIEGQFDTALAASGNGYTIYTWGTTITGSAGSYNNLGSITPGKNTLAAFIGGNGVNQLGFESLVSSVSSPGTLKISDLNFTNGVARAIGLWGPNVLSVVRNKFDNTSTDVQVIGQNASLEYRHNVHTGAGNSLAAHPSGTLNYLYIRNNLQISGTGWVGNSSPVASVRGESNEILTGTGAGYAFGIVGEGQLRWERMTAVTDCVDFRTSTSNLIVAGGGGLAVEGLSCNNPTALFFSLRGPVTLVVDLLGTASTGTNSNAIALASLSNGSRLEWGSVTNFTVPASNDFRFSSACDTSGELVATQAQLRAGPVYMVGDCSGAYVMSSALSTAMAPSVFQGLIRPGQIPLASLPACSASNFGGTVWDTTNGYTKLCGFHSSAYNYETYPIKEKDPFTYMSSYPNAVEATAVVLAKKIASYSGTITNILVDINVTGLVGTTNAIYRVSNGTNNCDTAFACNATAGPHAVTLTGTCTFAAGDTLTLSVNSQGDCTTAPNVRSVEVEVTR